MHFATALILTLALFMSIALAYRLADDLRTSSNAHPWPLVVCAILWGLFYYLTHP